MARLILTLLFVLNFQASGTEEATQAVEKCNVLIETKPTNDAEIPPTEDDEAEKEAWSERTAVITRYDHEVHCELAREFVEQVADRVVDQNSEIDSPKKISDLQPDPEVSQPEVVEEQADKENPEDRPASSQTGDSEYESADELSLQGSTFNFYHVVKYFLWLC